MSVELASDSSSITVSREQNDAHRSAGTGAAGADDTTFTPRDIDI